MTYRKQHNWPWKGKAFFFLIFISSMLLLLALAVMFLWNTVLTSILNVPEITYWQAAGLLVLCRILTGSLLFGNRHGNPSFKKDMSLKEKWMGMNETERIKFKEEWQKRCGIKSD